MTHPKHNLEHEVYLDPKDGKEHINHGMLEYTKEELENVHADYEDYHKNDVVDPNDGKINDWHTRHQDKHLEVYCDNHPDAFECRVYDDWVVILLWHLLKWYIPPAQGVFYCYDIPINNKSNGSSSTRKLLRKP